MKKTLCFAAVVLALPLSARAASLVALPALPSMPLNAPSALPTRPVSLPSLPGASAIVLPGVANLPKIAPALPSLPMPVIGRPEIALPSPVNPMPIAPTAVVRAPKIAAIATIRLAAPAAVPGQKASVEKDNAAEAERLQRLFDGNDEQLRHEGRSTLPESDLLDEIGIQ